MRIGLLVSAYPGGGVERTLLNLGLGLGRLGATVDLLLRDPRTATRLPRAHGLNPIPLASPVEFALDRYLAGEAPAILMTGTRTDDRAALGSRDRTGVPAALVTTVGTPLSHLLARDWARPWKALIEWRRIRADYARVDAVTAVSTFVAEDLRRVFGVAATVLPNPVIPEDLDQLAAAPCPHPWLRDGEPPVILAIGGLRQVKDFPTLLRAFARVTRTHEARLLILGEGRQRARLEALARRLDIAARCELPGFVDNPFPFLRRARLLALSSRREGLGNVLIEAMALGTPVVATACPGGVRELLGEGRHGPLVPVGDAAALAAAMRALLSDPPVPEVLRQAAAPYAIGTAARAYLDYFYRLGGGRGHLDPPRDEPRSCRGDDDHGATPPLAQG